MGNAFYKSTLLHNINLKFNEQSYNLYLHMIFDSTFYYLSQIISCYFIYEMNLVTSNNFR